MLEHITPVILTYNEAPNIGRLLAKLSWAKDIVVVDSYSDDDTLSIIARVPQVRVFERKYDSHANKWNYAIKQTGLKTEWVLAMDADYILSDELIEELKRLNPESEVSGYQASFRYCIFGRPLRGSIYPPVTVLYRHGKASYIQDGHTQRIVVDGIIIKLKHLISHDDRKPLTRWIPSQKQSMQLEAQKLLESHISELGWADRIRLMRFIAPLGVFFYCLLAKGALLDGRAGLYYAMQRMFAEMLLSLYLLENDMKKISRD
jgi:glycosyltransferase involved in cell wall biosynthesis